MTKLGLGTVQLGMPYGNNADGLLMPFETARAALKLAVSAGIRFFDTARVYGESEVRLGLAGLQSWADDIEISTKVARVDRSVWSNEETYLQVLINSCSESSQNLRTPKLNLLQFHQCDLEFLEAPSVSRNMKRLLDSGCCSHIGVSIYEPPQAHAALEISSVSSLQIPLNVLDRRFASDELVALYRSKNVRIISRSTFLQGVLIEKAPLPLVSRRDELAALKTLYTRAIGSANDVCVAIAYVVENCKDFVQTALIGVDSIESLKMNLALADQISEPISESLLRELEHVVRYGMDRNLLNPVNWNNSDVNP